MTEAARALLAARLPQIDGACYRGPPARKSAPGRVLARLGFRPAGRIMKYSNALKADVEVNRLTLDPADFRAGPASG